jgi:hypothetical protein
MPCSLSSPAPLSQWLPSAAPNRRWLSRWLAVRPMTGDRNSRYITLRNGACASTGRQPENMPTPSVW